MSSNDDRDAQNRAYYDAFAERYEDERGERARGYHDLLDELEATFVERFGRGGRVLEVGCGTGLVLERIRAYAAEARGVDLSPRMLDKARARGLDVSEASATALPFEDERFDVTCSFKVLAHVPNVELALAEMARVTKVGGIVVAELYNPWSLRGVRWHLAPKREVAPGTTEAAVYTRFDSPARVRALTPACCVPVAVRGIRILTPSARALELPWVGPLLRKAERQLADGPLAHFAGFYAMAWLKDRPSP